MAKRKAPAGAGGSPDETVETALFQRACGMEYEEVREKETIDHKTGEKEILVTRTRKYLPPDPRSAMFWLTNRKGERWRYKPEAEDKETGDTGVVELPAVLPAPEAEPKA